MARTIVNNRCELIEQYIYKRENGRSGYFKVTKTTRSGGQPPVYRVLRRQPGGKEYKLVALLRSLDEAHKVIAALSDDPPTLVHATDKSSLDNASGMAI